MPSSSEAKRTRLSPEQRYEQLVDIAVNLLMTQPLDVLSVDEVAKIAGVSRGLIFHYFPTVHSLRLAALNVAAENLVIGIQAALAPYTEPADRLNAGVNEFVEFISQTPGTFDLLSSMAASDGEFGTVFQRVRDEAAELIAHGLGGEVTPVQHKLISGWVALTETTVRSWVADPAGISREELVDAILRAAAAILLDDKPAGG